jgi:ATP-binding cassette subfamily B protein
LSTVKNADQIVVLEKGKIVEIGTHSKLVQNRGKYYQLVKNQLELGS